MSADAKLWCEDGWWRGLHDGCADDAHGPHQSLADCLHEIEQCGRYHYAWSFRTYPDGHVGLVGYEAGGTSVD